MSLSRMIKPVAVLLCVAGTLSGCSKPGNERMAENLFVGEWVQSDNVNLWVGQVATAQYTPGRVYFTVQDNKTWRMEFKDMKGNPVNPPQTAEGSWDYRQSYIDLKTSDSALSGEFADYTPVAIIEMSFQGQGDQRTYIHLRFENGDKAPLVPVNEAGGA